MIDNDAGEDLHLQKLAHDDEAAADADNGDEQPAEKSSRKCHTVLRAFAYVNTIFRNTNVVKSICCTIYTHSPHTELFVFRPLFYLIDCITPNLPNTTHNNPSTILCTLALQLLLRLASA